MTLDATAILGAGSWLSTGSILALIASGALLVGIFFMLVGAIGILRLPDCYGRIHAASKCTTLGLTGMLLAACFYLSDPETVAKAAVTIIFTFVATPIGSHMLAKAAHHGRAPQWTETLDDELARDKADPRMSVSDEILGDPDGPGEDAVPATDQPGNQTRRDGMAGAA